MSARPGYIRTAPPSPRFLEHLAAMADGLTEKETAALLWLTVNSVKSARRRIFERLGARNAVHAVHLAHQKGLLK